MNKFELISEAEYEKVKKENFSPKNGVMGYFNYDELIIPRRATKGSAGYDFISPISFTLAAGQTMKVPTCIKCSLNENRVLMMFPRSSYGFKYRMQLDNTVGVVDQDYYNNPDNEGHIFIKITNDSKNGKSLTINKGDAFAQGIIMSFDTVENDHVTTLRTGGIGSTTNS